MLTLDQYQVKAATTAKYKDAVVYPALGLASEAGEVAGKIKKVLRDNDGNFEHPEVRKAIADELGDTLWYVAMVAKDIGYNLSSIANMNLDKLQDRDKRGVIHGSGDKR